MTKDKEAGDTLAARLEQQRNTLDNEVTQVGLAWLGEAGFCDDAVLASIF